MQFLQINDMIVDASRGHLHKHGKIETLEPRVLDVLLVLARHQGEVVTHEALLKAVWPRAVVENNALQRCIGQLRKAFDDNARDQRLIVTYPRKGYSLVQAVSWHDSPEPQADAGSSGRSLTPQRLVSLAAGIGLFVIAGLYLLVNPAADRQDQNTMQPHQSLAQTDSDQNNTNSIHAGIPASLIQTDFYAIYAPDSYLVAYPRTESENGNQLWVRNVLKGMETRVTEQAGNYRYSAWSPGSDRLAYVRENGCYSLLVQDIQQSTDGSISRSSPRTLFDCQPLLLSPQWLSDSTLALIEASGQETVISLFDVDPLRNRQVIYQTPGRLPYHLSYSQESDSLAVAQYSSDNTLELLLLSPETGDTELLYSAQVTPGKDVPWHPVWNQKGTSIMISDQGRTINIAIDGTVREQVVPYISSQQGSLHAP